MLIRAPADLPRNQYRMIPKAKVDPAILDMQKKSRGEVPGEAGKDVIAGWRTNAMTSSEKALISNDTIWSAPEFHSADGINPPSDPLFDLMAAAMSAGDAAVVEAAIPYYSAALSEVTMPCHTHCLHSLPIDLCISP